VTGPNAETATPYVAINLNLALRPIQLRADGIGCPRCGRGLILRPSFERRDFDVHELIVELENHAGGCHV
jgi:hypothetical protein